MACVDGQKRRNGLSRVAAVAGLLVLLAAIAMWAFVTLNRFGSEPVYAVDTYGALKAELSSDCPGIRFPDLSRYEGLAGFRYQVSYDGGFLSMRNKRYLISFSAGRAEGEEEDPVALEGGTALSGLNVQAYNLRSFDGRSSEAPTVGPNTSIGGLDVELGEAENDPSGSSGDPTPFGAYWAAFALDGFYYRVEGTFAIRSGVRGPDADAMRRAALSEVLEIAESIIDQ